MSTYATVEEIPVNKAVNILNKHLPLFKKRLNCDMMVEINKILVLSTFLSAGVVTMKQYSEAYVQIIWLRSISIEKEKKKKAFHRGQYIFHFYVRTNTGKERSHRSLYSINGNYLI